MALAFWTYFLGIGDTTSLGFKTPLDCQILIPTCLCKIFISCQGKGAYFPYQSEVNFSSEQECFPVGYVLSAAVAVIGCTGGGLCDRDLP